MAAFPATVNWEVRPVGSYAGALDTNGAGFKTGGTGRDYSYGTYLPADGSAQKAGTDLAMHASTANKVKPTAAGVSAYDVGNVVYISAGTNWTAGWYLIEAQDGTYWTLSTSSAGGTCSATGNANLATYKMGGCFATPGGSTVAATISGNKIWVMSATYTTTTNTAGPGGPVVFANAKTLEMEGYETTRGDLGTRPIVAAYASTTNYLFQATGTAKQAFINLRADGAGVSGAAGGFYFPQNYQCAFNCIAEDFTGGSANGYASSAPAMIEKCFADNCTIGFAYSTCSHCVASACPTGFFGGIAINCISTGHTTAGFSAQTASLYKCCVASGGTKGFSLGSYVCRVINCIAEGASGNGYYGNGTATAIIINCASYNNVAEWPTAAQATMINCISNASFSTSPFVSSTDFRPNTSAGGGLVLRGAGIGVYGSGYTEDIGVSKGEDIGGEEGGGGETTHVSVA